MTPGEIQALWRTTANGSSDMMCAPWKHYKGVTVWVDSFVILEGDLSPAVIYMHGRGDPLERVPFVRSLEEFLGDVTLSDGTVVKRFTQMVMVNGKWGIPLPDVTQEAL